jgi:tRNA(fMet)-specific endonuclease VapC
VGLILDSSVVITAERKGKTVREALEQLYAVHGDVDLGLSVVTISELIHGAYRAQNEAQRTGRLTFINELCRDLPVYPVTLEIARLAGRIQGEQEAKGIRCGFEDLFIGVTALALGYALATFNTRHFQAIPGLRVLQP